MRDVIGAPHLGTPRLEDGGLRSQLAPVWPGPAGAEWLFKGKMNAKRVTVEKRHEREGEAKVVARSGELRQVFSNLIANSLDAIADNGAIKIRVSRVTAPSDRGAHIRITVSDDGKGIEPSAMPHLFEPLFTTKGVAGTGLGLWVSKQLVEKHGGSIRVRSSTDTRHNGRGTTVSILLPAAPPDWALADSNPPQLQTQKLASH